MLTENYIKPLNGILQEQGESLLNAQRQTASVYYQSITGQLLSSLSNVPTVNDLRLTITYPLHIRFLDLKRGRGGKVKGGYEPVYNKYVYGFLFAGLYKRLSGALSGVVRGMIVNSLNQ